MKKFLPLILLTLLLAGCVGEWVKVDDSKVVHKTDQYRLTAGQLGQQTARGYAHPHPGWPEHPEDQPAGEQA